MRKALRHIPWAFAILLPIVAAVIAGIQAAAPPFGQVQLPPGLDPLIRSYPRQTGRTLKALKDGVEAFDSEHYAAALDLLREADSGNASQIGDYVLLYRANSNLMLNRGEQALELFRLFQKMHPASPRLQDVILGECRALLQLRQPAAALSALQNPNLEESSESLYLRAQALEDARRVEEAVSLYLRVIARYVNSSMANSAEARLAVLAPQYWTRPAHYETLLERAQNLLRAGRYRDARALLLRLASVRSSPALARVRRTVLFAQAEYDLGKATTVLPLVKNTPASMPELHAHAMFLEAACYRRLEREDAFLGIRDKALQVHPASPYTERILYSVATYFEVQNRLEEAQDAYAALAVRFPKGEYTERAALRSTFLSYYLKRYDDASRGFLNYFNSFTGSRSLLALYWLGRCCQQVGDSAGAAELFSWCRRRAGDSYYGTRALASSKSLKQPVAPVARALTETDFAEIRRKLQQQPYPAPAVTSPSPPVAHVIERAHQLATADLPDLALAELRAGTRRFPEDRALKYLTARLYELKEDYYGVISTLRRAFPDYDTRSKDQIPQEIWDMLFPVPHHDVISAESSKYGLDPNLVLGLIRQESAFSAEAHSSANARGLMQVLPSTGRKLARETKVPRYSVRKLFRPEVNVALGTRHLASLLQHFDGRVEFALAAYNAGSDRVDRWVREFGDVDMAEFVELIPFSETRDYVKQVLTNTSLYGLLNKRSPGPSE